MFSPHGVQESVIKVQPFSAKVSSSPGPFDGVRLMLHFPAGIAHREAEGGLLAYDHVAGTAHALRFGC
jgi:hypothetical protein